jgi:hypothetical protein
MPIPPPPTYMSEGPPSCGNVGVNFSLDDVTAAITNATPTQLQGFVDALYDKCDIDAMTIENMTYALSVGTVDELTAFNLAAGTPSTYNLTGYTTNISEMNPAQYEQFWCGLMAPAAENGLLAASTEVVPAGTPTTLTWKTGGKGCLLLDLAIEELEASLPTGKNVTIDVPGCNGLLEPAATLTVPVLEGFGTDGQQFYQLLINMLSKLLRCCNPCPEIPGVEGDTVSDFGSVQFAIPPYAVIWTVFENSSPSRIEWQPPEGGETGGVQRFGKFQWLFRTGKPGPIEFINTDGQIFYNTNPECVGFNYWLNPTVSLIYQIIEKQAWSGAIFDPPGLPGVG